MAKLRAHGTELARREIPTGRIVVMSDGNIMRNDGFGWKSWRKLKAGVDPQEYARKFNAQTEAIPPEVRAYIEALQDTCDLEHRARLHTAISLMPNDPDGVWSELDDCAGCSPDLDDIVKACRLYESAMDAIRAEGTEQHISPPTPGNERNAEGHRAVLRADK
jgi:hypothetical protein